MITILLINLFLVFLGFLGMRGRVPQISKRIIFSIAIFLGLIVCESLVMLFAFKNVVIRGAGELQTTSA